eukprot:gene3849-7009_t
MEEKGTTSSLEDWKEKIINTYNTYKPDWDTLDLVLIITSCLTAISVSTLTRLYLFEKFLQIQITMGEFVSWFSSLFAISFTLSRSAQKNDFYVGKLFGILGMVSSCYLSLSLHDVGIDAEKATKLIGSIVFALTAMYLKSNILAILSSFSFNLLLLSTKFPDFVCKYLDISYTSGLERHAIVFTFSFVIGLLAEYSEIPDFQIFRWSCVALNAFKLFVTLFVLSGEHYYGRIQFENFAIEMKNYQYWVFNSLSCFCFLITLTAGNIKKRIDFLRHMSVIFFGLYMIQKTTEFPWMEENYALVIFFASSITIMSIIIFKRRKSIKKEE